MQPDPIVVQIPAQELDRRMRLAARDGAREALAAHGEEIRRLISELEKKTGLRAVMNTREAAAYSGVEPGTVLDWIKEGMPATKRGGRVGYLIRREDIDAWRTGGSAEGAA